MLLQNCYITYDPLKDKQYVLYTSSKDPDKFYGDMIIKDLKFNDSSDVIIKKLQIWPKIKRVDYYCNFRGL